NEPNVAADPGLQFPEPAEARFVGHYLGPALASARLSTAILGSDLSWDSSPYADALATGPAGHFLSGVAWHCYYGSPVVMSDLHAMNPALSQVVDECATEIRPFPAPEVLIAALRNWAGAVVLHNLALDPRGGPVEKPDTRCR